MEHSSDSLTKLTPVNSMNEAVQSVHEGLSEVCPVNACYQQVYCVDYRINALSYRITYQCPVHVINYRVECPRKSVCESSYLRAYVVPTNSRIDFLDYAVEFICYRFTDSLKIAVLESVLDLIGYALYLAVNGHRLKHISRVRISCVVRVV